MEYTVQKLASIAGVSSRTLRYYDEIEILKPARINSSGYRIYGKEEVDRLQQILFYRELGVSLESIKEIMNSPSFDGVNALKDHLDKLLEQRKQLDLLINNVNKSIALKEGRIIMSDKEKFEGFKKKLIEDNEKKYGDEIRKKYGKEQVEKSNAKVMNMTENEYAEVTSTEQKLFETLEQAFETGDSTCDLAQEAARLHKKWLTYYWSDYNEEAHANLAQMYVDDERFTAYYDKIKPGLAVFLRDAILVFTGRKK